MPDEAATVADSPFADRVAGVYLPWQWFEPYCIGLQLPIAELQGGWDVSDGRTDVLVSKHAARG
jgi:hypothetical protein